MFDCVVIGAGPGGLVSTKELLERGFHDVVCLEKTASLGGTFAKAYDNLVMTSSAIMSMFSDFWVGDGNDNKFWTKDEAVDYYERYAKHFGVYERIRFNSAVKSTNLREDGTWDVKLASEETLHTRRVILAIGNNDIPSYPTWQKSLTEIEYSHSKEYRNADKLAGKNVLVVGGGESGSDIALETAKVAKNCWVSLRSSTGWIVPRTIGSKAKDSSSHRGIWGLPREYGKNLKNIALDSEDRAAQPCGYAKDTSSHRGIWGLPREYGKQLKNIAPFAEESAQPCGYAKDSSSHRGIWGLPREYGKNLKNVVPNPTNNPVYDAAAMLNNKVEAENGPWGTYGTKTLSLPIAIANHGCKVVGEVSDVENGGKTLHTADGETLENVDVVIFCTGYQNYVAFLPEEIRQTDPRSLYKHMFHPAYGDKLAWVGWARPAFGSQLPIMEMQARLFAGICAGDISLPSLAEMEQTIAKDSAANLAQFEHNARRVRSLVDYYYYMDDLAGMMGCRPPLWQYFFTHPRIWLRMVYGATQATQFRLRGLGSKKALAQELLAKMPVSKFNYVVKAGIKGRIQYALKALMPKFKSQSTATQTASPSAS